VAYDVATILLAPFPGLGCPNILGIPCSPLIYFNANVYQDLTIIRGSDGAAIGKAAFVSNPYRAGEIFGMAVDGKDNKLYVAENASTANPLQWICADPSPGGGATPWAAIDFSPTGEIFVGKTDGTLWSFTLPATPTGPSDCAKGTAAENATNIFTGPSGDAPVAGIDPSSPNRLYVVVAAAKDDQRVQRLTRTGTKWTAQPIGQGLPSSINFRHDSGTFPPAVDPLRPNNVYFGGQEGLWQGTLFAGQWSWQLNTSTPESQVRNFALQRGAKGFSGVLRATIYGRGVWERAVDQGCGTPICWGSPVISCIHCQLPPMSGAPASPRRPASHNQLVVNVPYQYRGPTAYIRAVPLAGGKAPQEFLIHAHRIRAGRGTVPIVLQYSSVDAPAGRHTDALRLELSRTPDGPALESKTIPFDRWWTRRHARLLSIDAERDQLGALPAHVPVTIEINDRVTSLMTPVRMPVPADSHVVIKVPVRFEVPHSTQSFKGWRDSGRPLPRERSPELSLLVAEDVSLTAVYQH